MLLDLLVQGINCRFSESAGSIIHGNILQHDVGGLASGPLFDGVLRNRIELLKALQHRGSGGCPIQCPITKDGAEGLVQREADIPDLIADPTFLGFAIGFIETGRVFLDFRFRALRLLHQTKHFCQAGGKPLEESSTVGVGVLSAGFGSGFVSALVQPDMGIGVRALIYKVNGCDLEMF